MIILHIIFFVSIAFPFYLHNEDEATEAGEQSSNETCADKPPSYEGCAVNPPTYEMSQVFRPSSNKWVIGEEENLKNPFRS